MKTKVLVTFTVMLILLTLVSTLVLKIPPWHLASAVKVGTGLGAKLACSGYFVSGFNKQRILDDLLVYSPANSMLELRYDDENKTVQADLLGLHTSEASYHDGIGCALDYEGYAERHAMRVPSLPFTANDPIVDAKAESSLQPVIDAPAQTG